MSNWNISLLQSGISYASDGTIPRPNQDLETSRIATTVETKLADGSDSFMTPEVKYSLGSISMFFANTTSEFRTKIETYMSNGDKVKITTHTGEIFYGKFMDMKRVWFTGTSPDEYDVNITFRQTIS